MHKFLFGLLFLLAAIPSLFAQTDRYPYIQQPTETSALIAWRTLIADVGTLSWGTSASNLSNSQSGVAAATDHNFTISGLQPNTQYFYQVTNAAGFSSAIESFWTAKPKTNDHLSFLHYGDCGYDNAVQNGLSSLMEQEDVDFAVVAGDVDQGIGDNYDNVFFKVYRNMLARECHYTAIGNHDIIANLGQDFFDAFYQPTNNPQGSEHYYTFTWGNCKFICLDSNMDYSPGSDQHNFLLDELKCNDHQWVFVFCHHPPWTNAWDPLYFLPFQPWYQYDGEDDMRSDLVPYFEQYDLDFMLNGHSHCYQRGSMNGVEYVISGGAGSSVTDSRTCNQAPFNNPCSPNLQNEIYINQYVRFDISGDTATYVCIDPAGNVVDSVTIIKPWTNFANSVSVNNASGAGTMDGTASASTNGPHGPYTYNWSNGGTTATISGLSPGTYAVTITDAFGCVRMDSAVVGMGVGIASAIPGFKVTVSPNPMTESVHFSFPNPGREGFDLEILDTEGRLVRKVSGIHSESVTLPRVGMSSGMYFYSLRHSAGSYSGRLLVK